MRQPAYSPNTTVQVGWNSQLNWRKDLKLGVWSWKHYQNWAVYPNPPSTFDKFSPFSYYCINFYLIARRKDFFTSISVQHKDKFSLKVLLHVLGYTHKLNKPYLKYSHISCFGQDLLPSPKFRGRGFYPEPPLSATYIWPQIRAKGECGNSDVEDGQPTRWNWQAL